MGKMVQPRGLIMRYAVWGLDKTYRYKWLAAFAAGLKAFKERVKINA